jgi:hypothetical protein
MTAMISRRVNPARFRAGFKGSNLETDKEIQPDERIIRE